MRNDSNNSSGPWVLDPVGSFAIIVLDLFLESGKHVVKDSIIMDGEIMIPDFQRTVILMFNRQIWALLATVTGATLVLYTIPLFWFLLFRKFGRRKRRRAVAGELPQQNSASSTSTPLEVIQGLKTTKNRMKTVALTTTLLVTTALVTLSAIGMLLSAFRLSDLQVMASDVAKNAERSIHEAVTDLQEDLDSVRGRLRLKAAEIELEPFTILKTIVQEFKEQTTPYTGPVLNPTESWIQHYKVASEEAKILSKSIAGITKTAKQMDQETTDIIDFVRANNREWKTKNGKELELVSAEFKKFVNDILNMKKLNTTETLSPLENMNAELTENVTLVEKQFPGSEIKDIIKNFWDFPLTVDEPTRKLDALVKRTCRELYESKNKELLQLSEDVGTLLPNKTAEGLRIWKGDMFQVVSTIDTTVITYTLVSFSMFSLLSAIVIAAGMLVGLTSTKCFENCNPREYNTSSASDAGGNLSAVGVYAFSSFFWVYLILLLAIFLVSLYHLDACQSFKNYDILDFRVASLVTFTAPRTIDPNRTAKEVMETCHRTGNILDALGRKDLLLLDPDLQGRLKLDYPPIEDRLANAISNMKKIDVQAMKRTKDPVDSIANVTGSHISALKEQKDEVGRNTQGFRIGNLKPIEEVLSSGTCQNCKLSSGCQAVAKQFCDYSEEIESRYKKLPVSKTTIETSLYESKRNYENLQHHVTELQQLLPEAVSGAEKLNRFIGRDTVEILMTILRVVSERHVEEKINSLHHILRSSNANHKACATLLREYARAETFTCQRLLKAIATIWLTCCVITMIVPVAVAVAIPTVYLFKYDLLIVDLDEPNRTYITEQRDLDELQDLAESIPRAYVDNHGQHT